MTTQLLALIRRLVLGASLTPGRRALLALAGTYAIAALVGVFLFIGTVITFINVVSLKFECGGLLCSLINALLVGLVGVIVGIVACIILGKRLGMRWWFVPTLVAIALVGALVQSQQLPAGIQSAGSLLTMLAPAIAVISAAGLSRRTIIRAAIAIALVFVTGITIMIVNGQINASRRHNIMAEQFRTTPLPLYAPISIDDASVRLVTAESDKVIYDLGTDAQRGRVRVLLTRADLVNECGPTLTDLGGDIYGSGSGPEHRTVCRQLDGVVAKLWPDGAATNWSTEPMVDVASRLEPINAEWLIERSR